MFTSFAHKLFGTKNDRMVKRLGVKVQRINALESIMQRYSDTELRMRTAELKERYKLGASLDELLPEAFALVREASVRTTGLRHFDVQLIGGMVLHQGKIAEMRTGEGKTLVATLAAYLNALSGKAVHVVTVNDYLARRDAEWMGPIYRFLGLEVGIIAAGQSPESKRKAYQADIVYGTNNEFGFDYLRDNMVFRMQDKMQRDLGFAIIDEVDSILIDEARTPLIISGMSDDVSELYEAVNDFIPQLQQQRLETPLNPIREDEIGDYMVDEKDRQAYFTDRGYQRLEEMALAKGLIPEGSSLYDAQNLRLTHYMSAALRAHTLFHRDIDYIIKNQEVIIVDEHTGRTMEGRRWSDGLHQAVEAKEHVPINRENQTLASITFQNFFRLYDKLSGMTGTADTEAYELDQIYGLEVVVIPTNRPMIRQDLPDQIYLTANAKFKAILQDIVERHERQQPILVGTASIDTSELLDNLLTEANIPHQVLNAKQHEREARIIANAGRPGAITIATNMAGRGTDILLGGNLSADLNELDEQVIAATEAAKEALAQEGDGDNNAQSPLTMDVSAAEHYTNAAWVSKERRRLREEWQVRHDQVVALGGLHVIGSERHESRRIDNQLRGRAGRQGDPGSSRFYLSLDDHLLRIFAYEKLSQLLRRLGMGENDAIEHRMVDKSVENAQRKVEGHNFDIRKHLLEYDDIANEQRKVVYQQRDTLMTDANIDELIFQLQHEVVEGLLVHLLNTLGPDLLKWDVAEVTDFLQQQLGTTLPVATWLSETTADSVDLAMQHLTQQIVQFLQELVAQKFTAAPLEAALEVKRAVLLEALDELWKDHLLAMDHLREGIHLRGYAQHNPVQEYKRESFLMFEQLLNDIKLRSVQHLNQLQIDTSAAAARQARQNAQELSFRHDSLDGDGNVVIEQGEEDNPYTNMDIGRNSPCPCGSGRKYKYCHGRLN